MQIYASGKGATSSNKQPESVLKDFIESIDEVTENLIQYTTKLEHNSAQPTTQSGIQETIDDCRLLAQELLGRYEKLRLDTKPGKCKSSIMAVKCIWKQSELLDLQIRLAKYQSQFEWRILLSLRCDQLQAVT